MRPLAVSASAIAFVLCVSACSEAPSTTGEGGSSTGPAPCAAHTDCSATPETPFCDVASGDCTSPPPGSELGWKDGSPGSVGLAVIYEPDKLRDPWDLAFNPSKPTELWLLNHLDDSVIIIQDPGMAGVSWVRRRDPAADHFMAAPSGMAFGAVVPQWGQSFGVCGDTNNSANGMTNFMGPALFSADPEVFAKQTPDGLGSHLDMLHSTNFCRGIAHVEGNVYWVFNSHRKSLDRYDFKVDHGPGLDDHSDGEILRYVQGFVLGADNTPSHLVYNPADLHLYVADTGNKRIAKLDTTSGTPSSTFSGLEDVAVRKLVSSAVITDVVPFGTLEAPAGIELYNGLLYVTDTATSRFYAFDLTGKLVRHLDSGLPPGSLAGLVMGPDGKVYFVDRLSSRIYRIEPLP